MRGKLALEAADWEAEKLVEELGITALPVDPFAIAEEHGILVSAKDADNKGVSGFLMRVGDDVAIAYATHIDNEGFKRFSVSHELGHYFIPGHVDALIPGPHAFHQSRSEFVSDDRYEREADQFAASLLMPKKLFVEAMRTSGTGFEAIASLSSRCHTSITSTAIRFATLAEDPVAVVVSSQDQIEYCFASEPLKNVPGLQSWVPRGSLLPPECETRLFNVDRERVMRGESAEAWTNLDLWFDGAPDLEVNEDVVGLGTYGKSLTVLYSEEAVPNEDDEDDSDW